MKYSIIYFILNVLSINLYCQTWVTDLIPTIVNNENTGLGDHVMYEIFGNGLKKRVVPQARAFHEVEKKMADMTFYVEDSEFRNNYTVSQYPIFITPIVVMYNKKNSILFEESFKIKFRNLERENVVTLPGYLNSINIDERMFKVFSDSDRAIKMISDELRSKLTFFYVDAEINLISAMKKLRDENYFIDYRDFEIKKVKYLNVYIVFQKSPQGERLKIIADKKMSEMYHSGWLKEQYKKYNYMYLAQQFK